MSTFNIYQIYGTQEINYNKSIPRIIIKLNCETLLLYYQGNEIFFVILWNCRHWVPDYT